MGKRVQALLTVRADQGDKHDGHPEHVVLAATVSNLGSATPDGWHRLWNWLDSGWTIVQITDNLVVLEREAM